jgi:chromosome segregation ATPase
LGATKALDLELIDVKKSPVVSLYQMLNSSLVGQRRNMLQHQKFLKQHQAVLLRRQGHTVAEEEEGNKVNLEPILLQIETQRQQYSQEIQKLEREIDQIRAGIELNQGMIDNQTHDLDEKRQELKAIEENLLSLRRTTAECCGRVNLYQEALQPIQDSLDGLRQKLQGIGESLDQFQETGDYQAQAIAQLRHALQSLISQPELLAS